MGIQFNFNTEAIRIVADFIEQTETYQGADANDYFNKAHAAAVQAVIDLGRSRHEFETIYELMMDRYIVVDEQENEQPVADRQQVPRAVLADLKALIAKYE